MVTCVTMPTVFAPGVLTGYYTQCEQRGHSCDLFILPTRRKKTKPIYFVSHQQEKCHQYWPAERSARYQYFVVDPMAEYNMPQYILREFKVTDARVRASSPDNCRVGRVVGIIALLFNVIFCCRVNFFVPIKVGPQV